MVEDEVVEYDVFVYLLREVLVHMPGHGCNGPQCGQESGTR